MMKRKSSKNYQNSLYWKFMDATIYVSTNVVATRRLEENISESRTKNRMNND